MGGPGSVQAPGRGTVASNSDTVGRSNVTQDFDLKIEEGGSASTAVITGKKPAQPSSEAATSRAAPDLSAQDRNGQYAQFQQIGPSFKDKSVMPGGLETDTDIERGPELEPVEQRLARLDDEAARHAAIPSEEGQEVIVGLINRYKPEPETGRQKSAAAIGDRESEAFLAAINTTPEELARYKLVNTLSGLPSQVSKTAVASANYLGLPFLFSEHGYTGGTIAGNFLASILGVGGVGSAINAGYQTTQVAWGNDVRSHNTFVWKSPSNITDKIVVGEQRGRVQRFASESLVKFDDFRSVITQHLSSDLISRLTNNADDHEQLRSILAGATDELRPHAKEIHHAADQAIEGRQSFLRESALLNMGDNAEGRHRVTHAPQLPSRMLRGATSAFPPAIAEKTKNFGGLNRMGVLSETAASNTAKIAFGHNVLLSIGGAMLGEERKQMYAPKEVIAQPQDLLNEEGRTLWQAGKDIDASHLVVEAFPKLREFPHHRYTAATLEIIDKDVESLKNRIGEIEAGPRPAEDELRVMKDKLAHAETSKRLLSEVGALAFHQHDRERGRKLIDIMDREEKNIIRRYFDASSELGKDLQSKRKVEEGRWFSLEFLGQLAQQGASSFMAVVLGTVPASVLPRIVSTAAGGASKLNPVASVVLTGSSMTFGVAYSKAQPMLIQIKRAARSEIADAKTVAKQEVAQLTMQLGRDPTPTELAPIYSKMRAAENTAVMTQFGRGMFAIVKEMIFTVKSMFHSGDTPQDALERRAAEIEHEAIVAEMLRGATATLMAQVPLKPPQSVQTLTTVQATPKVLLDADPVSEEGDVEPAVAINGSQALDSLRAAVMEPGNGVDEDDRAGLLEMLSQLTPPRGDEVDRTVLHDPRLASIGTRIDPSQTRHYEQFEPA